MFLNEEITNCTRCGAPFTDFRLQVIMNLHTDRLKDTGAWEEIPNLCQTSIEYLCKDCFNTWVDLQTQMNIPYTENSTYSYNIGSNVKGYSNQIVENCCKDNNIKKHSCSEVSLKEEDCSLLEPQIEQDVIYES